MVSTRLKHVRQIGSYPQVGVNSKNDSNHHPSKCLAHSPGFFFNIKNISVQFFPSFKNKTSPSDNDHGRGQHREKTIPGALQTANCTHLAQGNKHVPSVSRNSWQPIVVERFIPNKNWLGWNDENIWNKKNVSKFLVDIFCTYIKRWCGIFGHGSEVRVIEPPNKKVLYKDSKQQKELLTTNTHGAKKKKRFLTFHWNPGCLMTGSLFHGLWNDLHLAGFFVFHPLPKTTPGALSFHMTWESWSRDSHGILGESSTNPLKFPGASSKGPKHGKFSMTMAALKHGRL